MSFEIIFRIAAIGILTAVVSQVLSQAGKSEIATLSTLAGVVVVLVMVVDMIADLFESIKLLFGLY